ncbi:MAG: primosomal protein N' [Bacteroidales bacterium]|jgi:primosomal protein N' (replication factor Y)|nr:primosomal protein N' [Bacteroidales bacterium]
MPCNAMFADIILPFAVKGKFTYKVPEALAGRLCAGMRVAVPFGGSRICSGIVYELHSRQPGIGNIKFIEAIADSTPVVNEVQLKLWTWMSEYYMCCEGEVMKAALPPLASFDGYRPRFETYAALAGSYSENELNDILDSLAKAPRQQQLLMSYMSLSGCAVEAVPVGKARLLAESGASPAAFNALVAKGILTQRSVQVSRGAGESNDVEPPSSLSPAQAQACNSIKKNFATNDIALLHGVTSSGKTEIYLHLIANQIASGKQALYLLPEIALTAQIIHRLKRHFGELAGVYHSRLNDSEKVEIWQKVACNEPGGYRVILGVRSSVFLPFASLGLVIVDEEHDGSYKQYDPAPRYHARDTAIMLARLAGAETVLGSATPSIESYHNAITGKYGLVELKERYGAVKLPEMIVADTREAYRKRRMVSHFTPELLSAMDAALGRNEQVILFQNRRGFSPYIECSECGWVPVCSHCAVNLTYHKSAGRLVCHYCGYSLDVPSSCGNCGSPALATRGFGTEKIEDEIKIVFPAARVARLDQDTTRGKNSFDRIIRDFESRRIDIMIGTQMISKGLDFENLTVVGVLNADNLLHFPDFRAHERSFQSLEQVSGRAGRRKSQGRVVIQTSDSANSVVRLVCGHDYENMFRMQIEEREAFNYPPFCRIIKIVVRHKDLALLNHHAGLLGAELKNLFGRRVLGPEFPVIPKVNLWHIKTIMIKIEAGKPLATAKQMTAAAIAKTENGKNTSSLRIAVDVDPY